MRKCDLMKRLLAIQGNPEIVLLGYEDGYDKLNEVSFSYVDLGEPVPDNESKCVGKYAEGRPGAQGVELVVVLQNSPYEPG